MIKLRVAHPQQEISKWEDNFEIKYFMNDLTITPILTVICCTYSLQSYPFWLERQIRPTLKIMATQMNGSLWHVTLISNRLNFFLTSKQSTIYFFYSQGVIALELTDVANNFLVWHLYVMACNSFFYDSRNFTIFFCNLFRCLRYNGYYIFLMNYCIYILCNDCFSTLINWCLYTYI